LILILILRHTGTDEDDDELLARLLPTFVDDAEFNNDVEDDPVTDAVVNNDDVPDNDNLNDIPNVNTNKSVTRLGS